METVFGRVTVVVHTLESLRGTADAYLDGKRIATMTKDSESGEWFYQYSDCDAVHASGHTFAMASAVNAARYMKRVSVDA